MPCYSLTVFLKPSATPEALAALFRSVARVVYREAGQFRRVENLGVRPLAYPISKDGAKFEEVRWCTSTYDIAPSALPSVGAVVQAEKDVLQFRHVLSDDPLAAFSARRRGREKLKRFAGAAKWAAHVFDPDTLTLKAAASAGGAGAPGAAAAASAELLK